MAGGEEQHHPHHHLPKMADDEEDDDNHQYDVTEFPNYPPNYNPTNPFPPTPSHHHNNHPSPLPGGHRPFNTPPPHHSTPPPCRTPTPPPPQKQRSPTPPPPKPALTPPPQKPLAPPAYTNFNDVDVEDYDTYGNIRRQICGVIFILILLISLTALILWLIYRPHKPNFTAVSAAVYSLNVSTAATPVISVSAQLTILTRNHNKHTEILYDDLTVWVYYGNQPITPPTRLPPLHHRSRSAVMIAPAVGGGVPVAVEANVAAGMAADEAYGVVGMSWVMEGRVRYRAGGWFRSRRGRVYVRCDVLVGLRLHQHQGGVLNGAVFSNPTGQLPLLGNPPCLVDI